MCRAAAAALAASVALAACTLERETKPPRSATEQLLISRAAERAALQVQLPLRPGVRIYIDADGFEGMDGAYAVGAIRDQLLRRGARLAMDRRSADVIVALTVGALSIDRSETTFGYSHQTDVVAFLFLAWSQDDLIPPDQREGRLQRLVPWADYLP